MAKEAVFNSAHPMFSAIDFLNLSYQHINELFIGFEHLSLSDEKKKRSTMICEALLACVRAEEVIFFPEVKKFLKEKGLLSAIIMEHSIVKYLVAEIENLDADSVIYDIKIKVLNEKVKQVTREKQNKLFPKIISCAKVDLWRLGADLSVKFHE